MFKVNTEAIHWNVTKDDKHFFHLWAMPTFDLLLPPHAPVCLADDCQLVTDVRVRLLSFADTTTLTV